MTPSVIATWLAFYRRFKFSHLSSFTTRHCLRRQLLCCHCWMLLCYCLLVTVSTVCAHKYNLGFGWWTVDRWPSSSYVPNIRLALYQSTADGHRDGLHRMVLWSTRLIQSEYPCLHLSTEHQTTVHLGWLQLILMIEFCSLCELDITNDWHIGCHLSQCTIKLANKEMVLYSLILTL